MRGLCLRVLSLVICNIRRRTELGAVTKSSYAWAPATDVASTDAQRIDSSLTMLGWPAADVHTVMCSRAAALDRQHRQSDDY